MPTSTAEAVNKVLRIWARYGGSAPATLEEATMSVNYGDFMPYCLQEVLECNVTMTPTTLHFHSLDHDYLREWYNTKAYLEEHCKAAGYTVDTDYYEGVVISLPPTAGAAE